MRRLLLVAVVILVQTASAASAGAAITRFPVRGEAHVNHVATGPDGNLWFDVLEPDGIGRITPTGAVTKSSQDITASSNPDGITAGPDGNVWFTEFRGPRIARATAVGAVDEFSSPSLSGTQPRAIAPDAFGNLWFTDFAGGAKIGRVSHLDQNPPTIETFSPVGTGGVVGITGGPDGRIWFVDPFASLIGRVDDPGSASPTIETFPLGGMEPHYITQGRDGKLWFTDATKGKIGRVTDLSSTPPTVTELSAGLPPGAEPDAIALGADGNVWFTDDASHHVGRVTPGGNIREFSTGSLQPLAGLASGPDGALWMNDYDHPAVVRFTIPSPAPTTGNLLRNPGFELGSAPTGFPATTPAPGWVTTPNFTTFAYSAVPTPPGGGKRFGVGGPAAPVSRAIQLVAIARRAEYVDRHLATAHLAAQLGGFGSEGDNASVTATFLAASGAPLGAVTIGPVLPADRGNQTKLVGRAASKPVPPGTRSIRVVVTATRTDGPYNDSYVDNVSLKLALKPLPAPAINGLTLSRTSFKAAKSGASVAPKPRAKTGTNLSYTRTLGGVTRFTVLRRANGHLVAVGHFKHTDVAGRVRLHFTGRVGGHRLSPGHYRLRLVPLNHERRRGAAVTVGFKIVS